MISSTRLNNEPPPNLRVNYNKQNSNFYLFPFSVSLSLPPSFPSPLSLSLSLSPAYTWNKSYDYSPLLVAVKQSCPSLVPHHVSNYRVLQYRRNMKPLKCGSHDRSRDAKTLRTLASEFGSCKLCSQKQTLCPPATTARRALSGEKLNKEILPSYYREKKGGK